MFDVNVTSGPSGELITTAEAKAHLQISFTDDDTLIGSLISAVRSDVERFCGISIGSQTRVWTYDFDGCEWPVPYGPVITITSIVRKQSAGDYSETLTVDDDYDLDGQQNKTIKVFGGGRCNVTYTCGYTSLPESLKLGMLEEIAYRYENRGDKEVKNGFSDVAMGLIMKYKDFNWE